MSDALVLMSPVFLGGILLVTIQRFAARKLRNLERAKAERDAARGPAAVALGNAIFNQAIGEVDALMVAIRKFSDDINRGVSGRRDALLAQGHTVEVDMGTKQIRYGKGPATARVCVVAEEKTIRIVTEILGEPKR